MRLFDKLLAIKNENLISFHVPGHKNSELLNEYYDHIESVRSIDVTEFPGTDDLHDPESCIQASQDFLSEMYHSQKSFYLINGTTCGIYAMIMAVTEPGDEILVARDCHKAVYDAVMLGHLKANYIIPEINDELNISLGLTLEKVKESIKKNPKSKAIVLTYPNYYGIACELEKIVQYAHSHNMYVLVDEAHGAHLILNESLPKSAILCGADIAVQSAHKSLPVFTQASVLHLNSDRVSLSKLKYMLNLHQTSSPSYILMTSLDIGMSFTKKYGQKRMLVLLEKIKKVRMKLPYFLENSELPNGFKLDPTKLVIKGKYADIDPVDLEENLRKNGLQLEFSNSNLAVFVCSIMNDISDFDYLVKMMEMLKFKCYSGIDNRASSLNLRCNRTINEAFYASGELINLSQSVNRISKEYIIPYPPGIPLVVPGETLTLEVIELIYRWKENNQKIVGLMNINKEDLKINVVNS